MASLIIVGKPGSGKTTGAMERAVLPYFDDDPKHWDEKSSEPGEGIIVTNVPMRREAWIERFGEDVVNARLIELEVDTVRADGRRTRTFSEREDFQRYLELRDKHGRGPMFVIDEAHKCIPKGMRQMVDKHTGQKLDTFPNWLLELFTDQRHYLISFTLITQEPFSMWQDVLSQMHGSIFFENAETKGNANAYTAKIWNRKPPRDYETVPFDKCTDAIKMPTPYHREAQRYFISNSKNPAGNVGRALEGRYSHARSIWKRPVVFLGGAALLVVGWLVLGFLTPKKPPHQTTGKPVASAKPAAAPVKSTTTAEDQLAIAELGTAEAASSVTEARQTEAAASVRLFSMNWNLGTPNGVPGPVVAVVAAGSNELGTAYLADYAAFYGYTIELVRCGFKLARPDNTRVIYDSACLATASAASASPASDSSAGRSSIFAPTPVGVASPALAGGDHAPATPAIP